MLRFYSLLNPLRHKLRFLSRGGLSSVIIPSARLFIYTGLMKRIFVFTVVALSSFLLFSSVSPVSSSIGKVCISPEKGSNEYLVLHAVKREYTDEWLEKYTQSPVAFALAYSSSLSSLLPLDDCLVSEENDGEIKVLDNKSGSVLTFLMKEGRIAALRIDL